MKTKISFFKEIFSNKRKVMNNPNVLLSNVGIRLLNKAPKLMHFFRVFTYATFFGVLKKSIYMDNKLT